MFCTIVGQAAFRHPENIKTRRATIGTAPPPVAPLPGPDPWMYHDPQMPKWAMPIIRHRSLFQGTCLVIQRADDQVEYWKLVFMVKSLGAEYLAMSRLHPEDDHHPSTALHDPRISLYSFRCNYADFSTAADVAVGPTDRLSILFRVFHNGGVYLSSDMHPISLALVLEGQDAYIPAYTDVERKARKAAKKFDEYVIAMPWLHRLDIKQGFHGGEDALSVATRQAAMERHSSAVTSLDIDDEQLLESLTALDKERIVTAAEHAFAGCADFVSRVRGGESHILKTGEEVHAHQSQCIGKFATAWARRRNLHTTFKATHGTHGPAEAKLLCRCWCHRMQFFYDLELASAEGPALVYSREHVESYVEPTELTILAADGTNPAWHARIAAIRAIPLH